MNRPLIGISGSHNIADRQMFVRENYMQSVLRAGGIPVLLPEIEDEETAKAILDRLDGLLLAGGGDVLPSRYGEETLPACGEDDPQRDIFELLIIPMAIARNMPIFGICLGHQLLALANGFKTEKLKYGHRGTNQPVQNLETGRVYISSQNHGYAVVSSTIDPEIADEYFNNVNDRTCEGVRYKKIPAFSVQFHPEACGGPHDTAFLFDKFFEMMGK